MKLFSMAILVSVQLTLCAVGSVAQEKEKSRVERRNYEFLGQSSGLFSHAVKQGDRLYISGLTAYVSDAQGKGISEQARVIFDRMRAVAAAEGADLSSLVKVTIFVTDMGLVPELREELLRQYGDNPPASSMVEIGRLFSPEANIEIEAILAL